MWLAADGGGYFIADWGPSSIALIALCVAVTLAVGLARVSILGVIGVSAWMFFGTLQVVSGAWAPDSSLAARAGGLTLLYAAALAIVVVVTSRVAVSAVWALWLTLGTAAVMSGWGVFARLVPGLDLGDSAARLSVPISYWNGQGALSAFAIVLAIGMAGGVARRPLHAAPAAAVVPLAALCLLFTVSRGSVVAAIVGLIAVVSLAPDRLRMAAMCVVTLGATAPLVVAVNGSALVSTGAALPEHGAAGKAALLALAGSCLAAGVFAVIVAVATSRIPHRPRVVIGRTAGAFVVVASVTVIGAAMIAGAGPAASLDDRFAEFREYAPGARNTATSLSDRLASSAGSGRWQNWTVAGGQFRDAPFVGEGAGSYAVEWDQSRTVPLDVTNAHSLYLEIAGENGVIGLILVITPLICVGIAAVRLRRGGDELAAGLGAAAGAAALALWVHTAGDWDWQLPALILPGVVVSGAAIGRAHRTNPSNAVARALVAGFIVLGVAATVVTVPAGLASDAAARDARSAARAGDFTGAANASLRAIKIEPSASAWQLRANLLADLGEASDADVAFVEAMRRAPREWSIPADWAAVLIRRGDRRSARVLIARASELNPLEPRIAALREAQAARRR